MYSWDSTHVSSKRKNYRSIKKAGHQVKIETQGTIGTEDELTAEEIKEADVVIIAADISISNRDRFENKVVLQIPTHVAMKSPKALIKKIEEEINTKA